MSFNKETLMKKQNCIMSKNRWANLHLPIYKLKIRLHIARIVYKLLKNVPFETIILFMRAPILM